MKISLVVLNTQVCTIEHELRIVGYCVRNMTRLADSVENVSVEAASVTTHDNIVQSIVSTS